MLRFVCFFLFLSFALVFSRQQQQQQHHHNQLADFGVAAVMGDADKHFTIVGSPYWMAPEIISATGHSVSSDIWSLGCTIVELLTGEPPYFGLNPMTAMFKIVQNPAPIPPDCSAPLRDFLTKCFEKDPTKRPSAEALLRHPWFDQPYTASMEVSAVREHVMAYQAEHSSKGRPSASTSGRGSRPMTRERRDSKVVVPEYQIERFDQPTSGPIGIAAAARAAASGAGDENSSSSESSMHDSGSLEQLAASASAIPTSALSVSTSSGIPAPRTERPMWQPSRSAHSSSGHERQQSCPPPSIAALVGPGASRPSTGARQPILRVSSQTPTAPPAAPTAPAPQPPTVTAKQSASPTTSSSGTSAREEEMAREIEDLKRRLMQVEGSSPVVVPAAPTSSAPPPPMSPAPLPPVMKSLKAQFIRDLQPTVADVPPSTMRVCCISAIGSSLWVGGADGTVTIYKLPSSGSIQASALEPHTSFKLHRTRIYSIIQVGTRRVWCSSEEGEIYIVPPRQPSEARHIAVHDIEHRMIKCLGYVPGDRARVWSCAPALSNSQIVVLSKGGHIKYKLTIKQAINSVTLSPSLETVWLGCYGAIIVCDALRGDLRREIKLPDAAQCKKVTQVTPVGDLIWCSAGKQIIVVDPYTFKIERVLQQSSDVERIAVCEGIVFAGDLSAQVQTYDPVSMTHVHTLSLPLTDSDGRAAPVKALCVSAAPGRPPAIFAGSSVTSNICVWSAKQT